MSLENNLQSNKAAVRFFWDAMNRGDLNAQMALCAEGVIFTVSGTTGVSGVNDGKPAVRQHLEHFGSLVEPGARMEVRELVAENAVVVCADFIEHPR